MRLLPTTLRAPALPVDRRMAARSRRRKRRGEGVEEEEEEKTDHQGTSCPARSPKSARANPLQSRLSRAPDRVTSISLPSASSTGTKKAQFSFRSSLLRVFRPRSQHPTIIQAFMTLALRPSFPQHMSHPCFKLRTIRARGKPAPTRFLWTSLQNKVGDPQIYFFAKI